MSTADKTNLYIIGVLQVFFGIASILFNSLAIVAINKVKQEDRHFTILLHLCLADLLCNLTTQITYTAILFMQANNTGRDKLCIAAKFINISGLFLCFASCSLLLFITAERYIAIFMPFRYERYKESKAVLMLVALAWVFSAAITSLLQLPVLSKSVALCLLGFLLLGGIFISIAHVKILCMARGVRRRIWQQSVSSAAVYTRSDSQSITQTEISVCVPRSHISSATAATKVTVTHEEEVASNIPISTPSALTHCNSPYVSAYSATTSNQETQSDSTTNNSVCESKSSSAVAAKKSNRSEHKTTATLQNSITNVLMYDRWCVAFEKSSAASSNDFRIPRQKPSRSKSEAPRKRISLAKLTAILCATCLVCYIPFVICAALYRFKMLTSRLLLHWMWTLLLVSSTLTPILFGFLNSELRKQFFKKKEEFVTSIFK